MSNTEFKKAFDSVAPDPYMESRVLENIKTSNKNLSEKCIRGNKDLCF